MRLKTPKTSVSKVDNLLSIWRLFISALETAIKLSANKVLFLLFPHFVLSRLLSLYHKLPTSFDLSSLSLFACAHSSFTQLVHTFPLLVAKTTTRPNFVLFFIEDNFLAFCLYWTVDSEVSDRKQGERDGYDIQQRFGWNWTRDVADMWHAVTNQQLCF